MIEVTERSKAELPVQRRYDPRAVEARRKEDEMPSIRAATAGEGMGQCFCKKISKYFPLVLLTILTLERRTKLLVECI